MEDRALWVILDGLGDRSCPSLEGKTPLEAASTPVMDRLAAEGCCGLHYPLHPGACTGSDLAHWSMFGYPAGQYPGRALMHARALGLEPTPGTVVVMGNIVPVRRTDGALYVDHGFKYPGERCAVWADALQGIRSGDIFYDLHHVGGEEVLVFLRGEASAEISDSDPFFAHLPILRVEPLRGAEDPALAMRTAVSVNGFLREARRRLREMGEDAALVTKWASRDREVIPFKERWGLRAALVASGPLYAGLALTLGMEPRQVRRSPAGEDLVAKMKEAWQLLVEGFHLVVVHSKEPDEAAHTGNPYRKMRVIEELDRALAEVEELTGDPGLLKVLTGDHCTPSVSHPRVIHSGEPVPALFHGGSVRRDGVSSFGETACAQGGLGVFRGADFLPLMLNWLNRARFYSSRPCSADIPWMPLGGVPLLEEG